MLISFDDLFKMNFWLKSNESWQISTSQGSTVVITLVGILFSSFRRDTKKPSKRLNHPLTLESTHFLQVLAKAFWKIFL